jgi:hypothetical protein
MSDGWRKFWTILLGVVFVLSFVVFVFGLSVRRDLLQPDLYSQVLSENNVFERVYTDVLADPAVQEQFKEITGININLIAEELYAQIVGGLFVILPPQRMATATDEFTTRLTAYLRGDTDELPEDVQWGADLTPEVLSQRIILAANNIIFRGIDRAAPIIAERTADFVEDDVIAYLDEVSAGNVRPLPTRLLQMGVRGATAVAGDRIINRMLGPAADTASPEVRQQMQAALAANDLPGAIAIAVSQRLGLVVTTRLTAAEPRLAEWQALTGISGMALTLGETRDELVAQLNTARALIAQLQTIMIIAAVLMLISIILIIWLHADDLVGIFKSAGWTLVIASGLVMLLWWIMRLALQGQIATALGSATVGLASMDAIIQDFVGALLNSIWSSVWTTALPWLVIGLIALLIGYSRSLLDGVNRLLEPVADYKWTVLALVFGAIVLVPLAWRLFSSDQRAVRQACNGHVELCDRPANEVVFAASHNAMSIADYRWIWPMHDGTITDQLEGGVRALLVDTHYINEPVDVENSEYLETYPEEGRQFARDLIARFQPPPTDRIVLCHEFCALGYSFFDEMLVEVRTFLEDNPREVVVMVIQDATTAADTTREIEEAGLLPYIYTHELGQPWSTLGEMIDSGQRLIVMAENEGPPPAWYGNAFDVTQETPYTFIFPSQFSCRANRGGPDAPFFMLNHWIQRGAPNRVDGAVVNAYDFLLGRAQQCQTERSLLPNFVAVNWWSQGDLMDVVDTLNGFAAVEPAP